MYYIIHYFLAYFNADQNCPFLLLFILTPLLICSLRSVPEIKYKIYHRICHKTLSKTNLYVYWKKLNIYLRHMEFYSQYFFRCIFIKERQFWTLVTQKVVQIWTPFLINLKCYYSADICFISKQTYLGTLRLKIGVGYKCQLSLIQAN